MIVQEGVPIMCMVILLFLSFMKGRFMVQIMLNMGSSPFYKYSLHFCIFVCLRLQLVQNMNNKHRPVINNEDQEQLTLNKNRRVNKNKSKVNDHDRGNKIKMFLVGFIIGFVVVAIISTVVVVFVYGEEKQQVKGEKEDKEIEELLQKLQKVKTTLYKAELPIEQAHQEESQKQEETPTIKADVKSGQPLVFKKLINLQSTYNTKPQLGVYIRKRRKAYTHVISQKKQNSSQQQTHLQPFNISFPQFLLSLSLIKSSPFLNPANSPQQIQLLTQQYKHYQQKYNISAYQQLPICVIVPSFRNFKRYRYFFNIYTILQQEYQNFHVTVIDDASDDRNAQAIQEEIRTNKNVREKVKIIKNSQRQYHMSNIYKAVYRDCKKGQLLLIIDGDDELIGKYVFKLINAAYHRSHALAIYTNHIQSKRQLLLDIGISRPYSLQTKQNISYRFQTHYYSHLRSTWTDLFFLVKQQDFKDKEGRWFTNAVDNAIFYPIFEMAGAGVQYLSQITYKYNTYTGNNVDNMEEEYRKQTSKEIREKKQYQRIKEWKPEVYQTIKGYIK